MHTPTHCAAPEVSMVLQDEAASTDLGPHSSTFWIMVAALKAFVVGGGWLGQLAGGLG